MIGRWLRRLEERRWADERRRAAEAEAKAERRKQPAEGDPTDPLLSPTQPTSGVSYDSLGQAHAPTDRDRCAVGRIHRSGRAPCEFGMLGGKGRRPVARRTSLH
jgi:hypothetical protein